MKLNPGFFHGGYYPTQRQIDAACDDYEQLEKQLGDDPNAIADAMGITRGSGCVLRRICRERAASPKDEAA